MSDTLLQGSPEPTPIVETTPTSDVTTTPTDVSTSTGTTTQAVVPEVKAADTKVATPAFPENWRELLAGQDNKRLQQLQRYSDLAAFANKTWALESKLTSGEYKSTKKLPDNATPEQVAEWRKEQGLPEKIEDYKQELPDGYVLGEADKPLFADFQKFAFEGNLPPEVMNKTLSWYIGQQNKVAQAQEVADVTYHEESKDVLMSEWGLKDYRQNLAAMGSIRDQMPEGLADRILAGRTADGKLIGDDPTFLKWFAALSRELNPSATMISPDSGKTIDTELEQIRKVRREDPNKYDQDKAMQTREGELIDAQLKIKARQG